MNVYDRLIQDHHEVEQLFGKIIGTSAPQERRQLCSELRALITAHDRAEEAVYYDAIQDRPTVTGLVQDGRHDHREVERLLEAMDAIPAGEDRWLDSLLEVQSKFLAHVREEEQKMFPRSRAFLPADQSEAMVHSFERREAEVLSRQGRIP